jgi:hypothetical protein
MEQRHIIVILMTALGFGAGAVVAHLMELRDWLDAKLVISLSTGAGFIAGHLIGRRTKNGP